jgi:hypothetical protein
MQPYSTAAATSLAGGAPRAAGPDSDATTLDVDEAAVFAARARRLSRSRLSQSARRSSMRRKSIADVKAATDENGVVRL